MMQEKDMNSKMQIKTKVNNLIKLIISNQMQTSKNKIMTSLKNCKIYKIKFAQKIL